MPKSPLEIIRKAEELQNPDTLAEVVLDIEEDVEEMEVKIQEIKEIAETTKKEKGEQGDIGLKGDKGDKGERGEKGEQGDKGDRGLDGKNGLNGKDGIDGLNGIDGINGKDGSPDTGEQIVDKINKQGKKIESSKLDLSKVEKDIKELKEKPAIINNIMGGQGGASGIRDIRAGTNISITKVNDVYTVNSTAPSSTSPLTTKGDLYGFSTVDARIPVGADGEVLTADSTDPTGVSWQPPQIGGKFTYYWTPTPSDVATYYVHQDTPYATINNASFVAATNGQLLRTYITPVSQPSLTFIPAGEYRVHIHANVATITGKKDTYLRAEIWETDASGVDIVKLADVGPSTILTATSAEYIIAYTDIQKDLTSTASRIATKVYAVISGTGGDPDITISVGDGTDSNTTFPAQTVSVNNFVPYTGATKDVNIGSNDITANAVNISGQTASRIASFDASKKIISLDTSTYPSLTELSYVKGVTSAIQTQLDGKQASGTYVTGATNTTLTLTGTTLGLNLANANTWTGQQTFNNNSGTIFQSASGLATLNTIATASSYTNVGGSGNRTALITVTTTITGLNGTPDYLVNGNTTESFFYWTGQAASGKYLRFDFGSGNKFVINEAKWYQDLSTSQGVWQWQGSNDASSWTSIGSTFTLGGSATQTQTELSSNTTAYRYYQLLGVSGSLSGSPYDREIEFKISPNLTSTTLDNTTGAVYLQPSGGTTRIGGMLELDGSVIFNSRPLVSSQWVNVGSNIQFPVTGNTAYVGIGKTPVTGYYLDVYRASRIASDTSNVPSIQYFTNSASNILRIVLDSPASPSFGVANGAVISLDNDASGLRIYDGSSTERYRFQRNGDAGFGTTSPSAKLHLVKTTEQLRVGYDASNYYSTTVGSTGGVTFDAVGSGASFTFSDNIRLTQTVTTETVTSDTTVTININGTDYKLLAKA